MVRTPLTVHPSLSAAATLCFALFICGHAVATDFTVLREQSLAPKTFTQGFEIKDDRFYVSSGGFGASALYIRHRSGELLAQKKLAANRFAEGLTVLSDSVYLLTWKAGIALQLNAANLEHIATFSYKGQGWGLCNNGEQLIMSNGSNTLQFREPRNFALQKTLDVTWHNTALKRLNELEYAHGHIWANVWHSNYIYKISPDTGHAVARWDLSSLVAKLALKQREAVLNGIAYDADKDAFWITGKLWPTQFLIQFHDADRTIELK